MQFNAEDYSDEQLVIKHLKGDDKSFEILIERYFKPIFGFIYRYIGNSAESENITQEVFVRTLKLEKQLQQTAKQTKTAVLQLNQFK